MQKPRFAPMALWLSLALLFAGGAAAQAQGYVSTEEVAEQLEMRRLPMQASGRARPTMILLRTEGHRVTVVAGVKNVTVNGESWSLERPVREGDGDLLVPVELQARLAEAMGREFEAPASASDRGRARGVVMIDPGHGGKDPGAVGPGLGLREKDVALDVSQRVARLLREKDIEVHMTRTSDVFVELDDRVAHANRVRPDLFVSIHADAAENRSVHGSTVFYPDDQPGSGAGDLAHRAARQQGRGEVPLGSVGAEGSLSRSVQHAAFGELMQEYRRRSWSAARHILSGLEREAGTRSRGAREAPYRVVRYPHCPSVLVELDFLTNAAAERRMSRPAHRERMARGVAEGIVAYLREVANEPGGASR